MSNTPMIALILSFLLQTAAPAQEPAATLRIGLPAPPISAKARNGRTISLAALRGKPVVLVFWGTS